MNLIFLLYYLQDTLRCLAIVFMLCSLRGPAIFHSSLLLTVSS
jgi:hypothetical protein